MNHFNFHKAASILAKNLCQGLSLSMEALQTLASNPKSAQQALQEYGATLLLRKLPSEGKVHTIQGNTYLLYKSPLPSEQQAKLSYEYLLSEFKHYLKRKVFAVILSESNAHLDLWLPEGMDLELPELWQSFITEITGPQGFSRGFGLVMNGSKLSDRGFGTLDTPLVSEAQPLAIAAFYLANLQHVQNRIHQRQNRIAQAEQELAENLEEKERLRIKKQLIKDQDMQAKELSKYRSEFDKMFSRLLREEAENHHSIDNVDHLLLNASEKDRGKLSKQKNKLLAALSFDRETSQNLQNIYTPDPFTFMKVLEEHPFFSERWQAAKTNAKQYTDIAANQLSTQKGDIYAKILWESCVLLFGCITISPLEPLLSQTPLSWESRIAGDNQNESCYSCGKLLEKNSTFRSRRLLFESPDQRTQSGGSSSPVKVCLTCAALSILSPVKFSPDTLVIRLDAQIERHVQQSLEQQALNEIGAIAGRYINISCTEKTTTGEPASQKLGVKQYAIAKLASLYPYGILKFLRPTLYNKGQEINLSASTLVATAVLMNVYYQTIKDNSKDGKGINMKLGESIRLIEAGEFIKASYILSKSQKTIVSSELEIGTHTYHETLEEEGMHKQKQVLEDVHAMIGLLMPFCRQLLAKDDLDQKTKWREIGKFIQSVNEYPTVFSYTTGKIVGGVGNLRRDNNTHFVFDKAKALMQKLGNIPEYKDKEGKIDNDPNKIRVTNDLIAKAYEYIYAQDNYTSDYDLKNFFYQVRLGLYARFPEAGKPKGDNK